MEDSEEAEVDGGGAEDRSRGSDTDSSAREESPSAIHDSLVDTWAVIGRVSIPIKQLLRVGRGAVIVLDREINDPVEIRANNRLIARGEIVILDEKIGIRITEMVKVDVARQER